MRLWHKDLIPYLPKKILLQQWRDLCHIAKTLTTGGKVKGPVSPISEVDPSFAHLRAYALITQMACCKKGLKVRPHNFWRYFPGATEFMWLSPAHTEKIYPYWHCKRYLRQCYYIMEEKFDNGEVSPGEWDIFADGFLKVSLNKEEKNC